MFNYYISYLCCPHQYLTTWKRYRLISLGNTLILQGSGNNAVAAPFGLLSIVKVKFQHKCACADAPETTAIHLCYTMYSHLSCIFVSVILLWRLSKATWSSIFYDLAFSTHMAVKGAMRHSQQGHFLVIREK